MSHPIQDNTISPLPNTAVRHRGERAMDDCSDGTRHLASGQSGNMFRRLSLLPSSSSHRVVQVVGSRRQFEGPK